MRFTPLLFDPGLDGARTGSRIERWSLFKVDPIVDLADEALVRATADALVDAELPSAPMIVPERRWFTATRAEARRVLLYPLRFSMAYTAKPALDEHAFAAADRFLAAFSPEALVLTPQDGLGALLDDEGRTPRGSWAYASSFALASVTFEASLIVVDWSRVGLFVATDED